MDMKKLIELVHEYESLDDDLQDCYRRKQIEFEIEELISEVE